MFQRKVSRLLSETEREDLITYLSGYPGAGVIMEGSGGIRKLRNEKANLSGKERHLLAKAVENLVMFWRQNNGQSIH